MAWLVELTGPTAAGSDGTSVGMLEESRPQEPIERPRKIEVVDWLIDVLDEELTVVQVVQLVMVLGGTVLFGCGKPGTEIGTMGELVTADPVIIAECVPFC